jgi:hypothetical protein
VVSSQAPRWRARKVTAPRPAAAAR